MNIIDKQIVSKRNTMIPITVVEADTYPAKLLVLAHGFKAKRTEDGRFLTVAKEMAKHGVMSVMMGFPGCDESKEDFFYYTMENCLDDIDSSVNYVKAHYEIKDDMAMIGYSMGGRLTCLYIQEHPEISCIGLWASASYDGFDGKDEFLGEDLSAMKKEMEEKGYCIFHNGFDDTYIKLNKQLIDQIEATSPVRGLKGFKGSALLVHGDADVTVPYDVAERAYEDLSNAAYRKLLTVKGADHGFGAWNERPDLSKQLTDGTIAFLLEHFV